MTTSDAARDAGAGDVDDQPANRDPASLDPAGAPRAGGAWRRRRWVQVGMATLAVALTFIVVTAFTGFPAPGGLQRFTYRDLAALSDRVNEAAGEYRTADDCWRQLTDNDGPLRSIAAVDHLRSRVVVRAYAAESGVIDPDTFEAVTLAVDDIIQSDPRFSWAMVQIEPSPDGWSPLVSCRLVTRGWITGF